MENLDINEEITEEVDCLASASSTTIAELADDCLIKIFKYLDIPQKLTAEQGIKYFKILSLFATKCIFIN